MMPYSDDELKDRIVRLEAEQRELYTALLAYLEADISVGWMVSAKALADLLSRRLGKGTSHDAV